MWYFMKFMWNRPKTSEVTRLRSCKSKCGYYHVQPGLFHKGSPWFSYAIDAHSHNFWSLHSHILNSKKCNSLLSIWWSKRTLLTTALFWALPHLRSLICRLHQQTPPLPNFQVLFISIASSSACFSPYGLGGWLVTLCSPGSRVRLLPVLPDARGLRGVVSTHRD